jgi:hypothetical protein
MLPNFKWNTTTKLICLILLVSLACMMLNFDLVEKFVDGEILNCPDRLYFDGNKYYLFKMSMPIIEGTNPIVYKTYEEYLSNKPASCEELPITKPFKRELSNKKKLPVLPYQWQCNRDLAFDTAKQLDCVNKSYKIFTEDECNLFKDMPAKYYTNNAVERCMVSSVVTDFPEYIGNLKPTTEIGFSEEGLIRVGSDLKGDPFRNIS